MSARRIDGAREVRGQPGTSLVAIGNYDGVHRGHQAVIGAATQRAVRGGLRPLVLTFHPHPHEVLGGRSRQVLTTIERKVELLTRIHPELTVVVEPFTRELASLEPEAFAREMLVGQLGAKEVVVGENFRFGRGRQGDLALLIELGAELGFEARAEPLQGDAAGTFSSTRARAAILGGDLAQAELVLGRPHSLSGTVARGDGRGRQLGVPTANLVSIQETLPPDGVYACLVDEVMEGGRARQLARAVANLGERPTVDAGRSFEAHLLDFSGDLYDRWLRVHLVARLRDERRFPSLGELAKQIALDVVQARSLLAERRPDEAASGGWH